ncbi:hypothetical protein QNM99_24590 [Pseudomonas sp. PCH446]
MRMLPTPGRQPRLNPFFSSATNLILLPVSQRRLIINDPVFQIWMALAFQHANAVLTDLTQDTASLQDMLLELPAILQRITQTAVDHKYSNHPPIRRFNVDPLIAAATPPSYEFPKTKAPAGTWSAAVTPSTSSATWSASPCHASPIPGRPATSNSGIWSS